MPSKTKKGSRSQRARLLVSLTALLTATALGAACGDDGDDDAGGLSGAGGSAGTAGNTSGGGTLNFGGEGFGQGGGDFGQGGECGGTPFEADPVTVNILLVIDKSGSMNQELEEATTRWAAMESAVNAAIDGTGEGISYGLLLYPGDASCGVPAAPDVEVRAAADAAKPIADALSDTTPSGATPTAGALAAAFEYFDSGDGADLEGLKYVLLATDGGPNCGAGGACDADQCTFNIEQDFNGAYPLCADVNCCENDASQCLDDADTLAASENREAAGIRTIVVGIPGTEAYADLLDQMAEVGGSPNPDGPPSYYAVEEGDAEGLQAVLERVTMGLIRDCEFQLASDPPDPDKINVTVDHEVVPFDEDGEEGWTWDTSTDPDTVVLVGAACEQVRKQGAQSVDVVFGCPKVVIPK